MNVVEIHAINIDSSEHCEEDLKDFCLHVLKELGKNSWSVSILLCDDAFIRELNGKYRRIYEPTDVLSFCQNTSNKAEGFYVAGDVVISVETMKKNALEQKIPEKNELKRLLAHGILHLAGMDHDGRAGGMLDLQERILSDYSGV